MPFHIKAGSVALGTMPVQAMENVEIEEEIAKMDGDLLSQLLKCHVNPLIIATLSKAMIPSSLTGATGTNMATGQIGRFSSRAKWVPPDFRSKVLFRNWSPNFGFPNTSRMWVPGLLHINPSVSDVRKIRGRRGQDLCNDGAEG